MSLNNISNNLILELHVPDLDKAKAFYALFGFYELSSDPITDDELGYLILARNDEVLGRTIICFYGGRESVSQQEYFVKFPSDTLRGYAVETTIPVSNIDKLWDYVLPNLASESIAQALEIKSWGVKDFRIVDPFGFYFRFTEIADWGQ
ncbi:MAG: hypothetical protein WCJ19_01345 [bacterium]